MGDITVVIPCHPERIQNNMLLRAMGTCWQQDLLPTNLIVQVDETGEGAGMTRQKGLSKVDTEWVAFLDSDDFLLPHHLRTLAVGAQEHNADYVYSWFAVLGREDNPLNHLFGRPWDNDNPIPTGVTVLVKTELAKEVGFLNHRKPEDSYTSDEDVLFTIGCRDKGAKIVHVPDITWVCSFHEGNTGGRPYMGDTR